MPPWTKAAIRSPFFQPFVTLGPISSTIPPIQRQKLTLRVLTRSVADLQKSLPTYDVSACCSKKIDDYKDLFWIPVFRRLHRYVSWMAKNERMQGCTKSLSPENEPVCRIQSYRFDFAYQIVVSELGQRPILELRFLAFAVFDDRYCLHDGPMFGFDEEDMD